MKIPDPIHSTVALIDQHHAAVDDPPRPHLGASMLGHHCERWLWLSFRWAVREQFPGRLRRLFRRGHNEESTIVADLVAIGMDVRANGSEQDRISFGHHIGGSPDAIIESGVPEAPKKRHIGEFKTHNKKSFDDLEKQGVEKAKPQHFVQMQIYMHGLGIDRALYVAVCKDDDRMYAERVRYDRALAEKYLERGRRVTMADRIPPPISTNPSWYQCKWCPAHALCHEARPTQEVNCRTCAHATALENSTWRCERHQSDDIPEEFQRTGCDSHVLHPDLVPWKMTPGDDGAHVTWTIDGREVINGPDGYKSKDILAHTGAVGTPVMNAIMQTFPGAEIDHAS